ASGAAVVEERANCVRQVAVRHKSAKDGAILVPTGKSHGRLSRLIKRCLRWRQWAAFGEPDEASHVRPDQSNPKFLDGLRLPINARSQIDRHGLPRLFAPKQLCQL